MQGMHGARCVPISLLLAIAAWSQSTGELPSFEVVAIRPVEVDFTRGFRTRASGGPGSPDPTRFAGENLSLAALISMAYGLSRWGMNAPDWTKTAMFQISATLPEGATKDQMNQMMQRMLAERFQLKFHWETKDHLTYELVVAKNGPKLKESEADEPPFDPKAPPQPVKRDSQGFPELPKGRTGSAVMFGFARTQAIGKTTDWLANQLMGQVGAPVTNATGLKGKYDFTLSWSDSIRSPRIPAAPERADQPDYPEGPTLMEALKEQLGLALEKKKGTVQVLTVDHVEKKPSEN